MYVAFAGDELVDGPEVGLEGFVRQLANSPVLAESEVAVWRIRQGRPAQVVALVRPGVGRQEITWVY
jgi:hypothetical protein